MIQLEKTNIGDIFYERGVVGKIKVLTKPIMLDGSWQWEAETENGVVIKYLVTPGFEHYGPSIYNYEAYR